MVWWSELISQARLAGCVCRLRSWSSPSSARNTTVSERYEFSWVHTTRGWWSNDSGAHHWLYDRLVLFQGLQFRKTSGWLGNTIEMDMERKGGKEGCLGGTSWISIARRATSIGKTRSVLVSTIWYGVLYLHQCIWIICHSQNKM